MYVKCSLEECIERDPKNLYKKALAGEIPHFTGVSDPYEEPENPDLVVDTEKLSPGEGAERVLQLLLSRGGAEVSWVLSAAAGFLAELVDGALGMAYGVTASTMRARSRPPPEG